MPFKKGDFLLYEYTARVKETGEVFDTTQEDLAKEKRLYKEGEIYEPRLIVVGEGWVLAQLDESLLTLTLNKLGTVEIPPDKAFGPRDSEKVRMVPLRRLRDKGITPTLGMRIEYDKKMATIRTVGAGRVQLDFNPPLAGKTLVYEVTVKKKLRTREEKALALIRRRIPLIEANKFTLEFDNATTTISIPEEAFYLEGVQIAKRGLASDIHRFFPTIGTVKFVEIFKNPTAPKKPKAAPVKKERKTKKRKSQAKQTAGK